MNYEGLTVCAVMLSTRLLAADCSAQVQVPTQRSITPWSAEALAQGDTLQESLDVRIVGAGACGSLLLGAEVTLATGMRAHAQVRMGPNGAKIGAVPGSGQPLVTLVLDESGAAELSPVIEWSAQGQPLPAGRQSLSIRWRLFAADTLLPQALIENETQVQADVPAVLDVELIAAGRRQPLAGADALLDFGEIETGATREVEIEIRGNASAQLALSHRWGELRLRGRSEYTIPYSLLLDGRAVNADGLPQPLSRSGDRSHAQLRVRIGDVERRASGVYEDTLTVIVAPE